MHEHRGILTADQVEHLLLAAIDRAVRHSVAEKPYVGTHAIADHLALDRNSGEWRRFRSQFHALEGARAIEQVRRHGMMQWGLTHAGRARLYQAQQSGTIPALPESPQHRAWREARTTAEREIDAFRRCLGEVLNEASVLLAAEPPPRSDAWFDISERLRRWTWQVGSATHCLSEWTEPDDAFADADNGHDPGDDELPEPQRARLRYLRSGRRSFFRWRWI